MATSNIIRASDLDVNKLTFSDVRTLDNGGKMVNISYQNQKFFLQLPTLVSSYGLSVWPNDKGGFDKMHLDLSMKGYDGTNPVVKTFFEKMVAFDDKLVDTCLNNSKTWLRKNVTSREVVQAVFTPLVKYSKDKATGEISTQYPPVVRLQIPRNRSGDVDVTVYDNNKQQVNFQDVNFKGAQVTAIVQVANVWIISGKFGVTIKVHQMKVNQQTSKLSGYAFVDDEDDPVDNA
jgi:hypothetical protein